MDHRRADFEACVTVIPLLSHRRVGAAELTISSANRGHYRRGTIQRRLTLEWAGVLTWQNRITRILVRERDLFGQWAARWQVIRTSNAYVFTDPKPQLAGVPGCKSENPTGTQNQEILTLRSAPAIDPNSQLERALRRLGAGIEERLLLNRSGGQVGAP